MVGIIDYGTGNLRSVKNALQRAGAEYVVSADGDTLNGCDKIILPGVGDAGWAIRQINEKGLSDVIRNFKQPVLGICLGMQIMCSYSEESNATCLGIFPNTVTYMGSRSDLSGKAEGQRLKIPHIGWNTVHNLRSELFNGVEEGSYLYFVHSYCAGVNQYTIATTVYTGDFSAAIQKENFYGCQFHPEKSGPTGERIIMNFLKL